MSHFRWTTIALLTALSSATATTAAYAQGYASGADSLLVAVPAREPDEIRRGIDAAVQARRDAETDATRAERMRSSARARLILKRMQLDTLRAREKAAKDAKLMADGGAL
ncbi:MAG: hypothetical protein H0U85_00195, partial [Gemmatimonadales bacterium]|nr:hypothetical protein [Gemmatimonadales bacterium]